MNPVVATEPCDGLNQATRRVVAVDRHPTGDILLRLVGVLTVTRDRFSIEVGPGLHVGPPPRTPIQDMAAKCPWVFVNHSCRPNAAVRGQALVATRDIAPGEEITFDYTTTESELAEPFHCRCGFCDGQLIRGRTVAPSAQPAMAAHA